MSNAARPGFPPRVLCATGWRRDATLSTLLGIVAMRLVIGQLLAIVRRYPALVDGAFIIIAWVGIKLLIEYLHAVHLIDFEVPRWLSLTLIVVIFAIAFAYARRHDVRSHDPDADSDATRLLAADTEERG